MSKRSVSGKLKVIKAICNFQGRTPSDIPLEVCEKFGTCEVEAHRHGYAKVPTTLLDDKPTFDLFVSLPCIY